MSQQVLEALAVTAELMGNEISPIAAKVMYSDLSMYPEHLVIDALVKVRREVKGRLTIADVISRIDDGRPGVEEAWSMMPSSESQTVVWTDEMRVAYGVCCGLLESGDKIAARMAFKESYSKALQNAKASGNPVEWVVSLGHEESGRASIVEQAVKDGKLTYDRAKSICYDFDIEPQQALTVEEVENKKEVLALIADMGSNLKSISNKSERGK